MPEAFVHVLDLCPQRGDLGRFGRGLIPSPEAQHPKPVEGE
jgi:hypothetical protein